MKDATGKTIELKSIIEALIIAAFIGIAGWALINTIETKIRIAVIESKVENIDKKLDDITVLFRSHIVPVAYK
jgi:hypothetical protein